MDEILKSRKLNSASARRKKFQERQQQQTLEIERRHAHKHRVMLYDHMADRMDEVEEHIRDRFEQDTTSDRGSSVDTTSERSALTPDELLTSGATFDKRDLVEVRTLPPLKIHVPDEDLMELALDENRIVVPTSPSPVLQASLATLSDFRYDRFSVMFDSPNTDVVTPELDFDESFSPIETATHVSYQLPKSRPSLISITTVNSIRSRKRTPSLQSPLSATKSQSPDRSTKRLSTSSVQSGYPAAEATLHEVPDLPSNAFELIANASQESLLLINAPSRTRAERKSSLPRLSTSLSHARMSSIKSLIKTPTSGTHSRTFSGKSASHTSRPSTASISGADVSTLMRHATSNSSTATLGYTNRPPTSMSMASVSSNHGHMTALPSVPARSASDSVEDDDSNNKPNIMRKKSFSTLRRRSESIGQAIKGLGKMTTKHDFPMPSPPIMTPKLSKSSGLDLSKFPTPPLPSPRSGKNNVVSTTSSTIRSSNGVIGLGLKSVEGLWQR